MTNEITKTNARIINRVPHSVYLLNDDNTVLRVFPKSNGMIRLREVTTDIGTIDGIPISSTKWSEPQDVPKEEADKYFIVSQLVKNALPLRKDLLVPKNVVRDDQGNIIGCKRLDIGSI